MTAPKQEKNITTTVEFLHKGKRVESVFSGYTAAEALAIILEEDPDAKFHEALFYARGGNGGFGKDTIPGSAISIQVDVKGEFKKIQIGTQHGDDTVPVAVSSKKTAGFIDELEKLDKVSADKIAKMRKAFDSAKANALIVLDESERFGVKFFRSGEGDDAPAYLDSIQAEAA